MPGFDLTTSLRSHRKAHDISINLVTARAAGKHRTVANAPAGQRVVTRPRLPRRHDFARATACLALLVITPHRR